MLSRLIGWLRRLFGLPERREVRRLDAGEGGRVADAVHEEVARKGPLKPAHRRKIVRDERLMPKPGKRAAFLKPPKVMSADEADRLFAATLRTRSRNLRTLATDVEQLQRYGLPVWKSEADVAAALGISVGELRHFSIHREREKAPHYLAYAIKKRSGGTRIIHAPKRRLKALQRLLSAKLVSKLPVSAHAHGFVKGRSVKTCAEPHVGKAVLLRLDLKDFFPSVTWRRVRGLLIALGYSYPVAATLSVLMTEAQRQPVDIDGEVFHVPLGPRTCVQGAPTSPGVCNALLLRLDRRLAGLAAKHGFAFTRYADDLSFSGDEVKQAHRLRKAAERVVREEGFEVNAEKTRVMTRGGRMLVTGVTVNDVLGISRQKRRRIRAMLHQAKKNGTYEERRAELDGQLAWVHSVNATQAAKLRK